MNNTPTNPKSTRPNTRITKVKGTLNDKRKKTPQTAQSDIQKLKLLVTVVDRTKAELYMDLLQAFDVNAQMAVAAQGTATTEMLHYLGLSGASSEKTVIFSIIRENMVKNALEMLEDKFHTIKNGKGIAFTTPLSSIAGVAIYQFLSNNRMNIKE